MTSEVDVPEQIARDVVRLASAAGTSIATAESCTGGAVAGAITAVPGASATFRGAIVAYADDLKADLLGVDAALIADRGAVSTEVAAAMAGGVASRLGADLAVAVTGVAGPAGGTEAKPVGTVCLAVSTASGTVTESRAFDGDRAAVRRAAGTRALELLRDSLQSLG